MASYIFAEWRDFFARRSLGGRVRVAGVAMLCTLFAGCFLEPAHHPPPPDPTGETPVPMPPPAPAEATFSKSYSGTEPYRANAVIATQSGNALMVGVSGAPYSNSLAAGDGGDLWINQVDSDGNIEVQRLIGELSAGGDDASYSHVRPLTDGGAVVVGEATVRANGRTSQDIAIARLDAQNRVVWARTFDSGPWLNYQYIEVPGEQAAASDSATDVWQQEDGSFLVAAISLANLTDPLHIGYHCPRTDDPSVDACSYRYSRAGAELLQADSMVIFRVSPDGELRWAHRFTEQAFNPGGEHSAPIVRSTHDGGAIAARSFSPETVIYRLQADGSPAPHFPISFDGIRHIDEIEQTDDVDDSGLRDGVRDDGFILSSQFSGDSSVAKLSRDGAISWKENFGFSYLAGIYLEGEDISLYDVHQRCTALRACAFVAAGSHGPDSSADPGEPAAMTRGYLLVLDEQGNTRAEVFANAAEGQPEAFERISGGDLGTPYRLLGKRFYTSDRVANDDGRSIYDYDATAASPQFRRLARLGLPTDHWEDSPTELSDSGGAVALLYTDAEGDTLYRLDAQGGIESNTSLGEAGTAVERGLAAAEIARGQFVIAGQKDVQRGWLMRYDQDSGSGDHVVWQLALEDSSMSGRNMRLAASGDGGVIVAAARGPANQLLKFDAEGHSVWSTGPIGTDDMNWRSLVRLPASAAPAAFVALASSDSRSLVAWISAAGRIERLRSYVGPSDSLAVSGDGSLLLASPGRSTADLATLRGIAANGNVSFVRLYHLVQPRGSTGDVRIIAAPDGGFVLAMDERELLGDANDPNCTSSLCADGSPPGGQNVLVMKLDATGAVEWARDYGAYYDEGLGDVTVRADGVILVAGWSDSMSDQRAGWLLKLGADGLVASDCFACLASLPTALIQVSYQGLTAPREEASIAGWGRDFRTTAPDLPLRSTTELTTAQQCSGKVNPAGSPVAMNPVPPYPGPPAPTPEPMPIPPPPPPPVTPGNHRIVIQVLSSHGVVLDPTGATFYCRQQSLGPDCERSYSSVVTQSLTATPDADWTFRGWGRDCASFGTARTISLTTDRDYECTADFGPAT